MGLTRIRADQISDIDYKQAVRVLTLSNVILSGGAPSQVDGVNLNFDDRILVAGQTTASQNGLYYVATLGSGVNGTWVRTSDANATGEISAGMIVMVTEGNTYADTSWKLITNDPIILGTTSLAFAQNTGASFGVINANGTPVAANGVTSTAVFSSGNNLVLTGNATSDTITFAVSDTPIFTTVSATGNISGSYIIGNGSQLTGLPAGYANSNAVAYGEAGWAGNIIPSANVTYSLGNVTNQWKSVYVGANTLYINNVAISVNSSNILTVAGANVVTQTSNGNITTGNLSVTGNITGSYIIGNGSQLTSLTGANVTGTVANATYAVSSGTSATVTTNAQPNITSTGTLTSLTASGLISTTGNISGNYIIGNGSLLTNINAGNITGAYGNANVAAYLPTYTGNLTAGNISVTGAISTANITLSGDLITGTGATLTIDPNGAGGTDGNVVITGNLTVQGTTTTINSNTISTNDLTINMANNAANATAANNGGIEVGPVGSSYATLLYNTASNVWVASLGISSLGNVSTTRNITGGNILTAGVVSATGNVTGNYLLGNGSQITGLPAGYANSDVAAYLASGTVSTSILTTAAISATGNITGNYFIGNGATLSSITGANVTGTVANATFATTAGTVTTNAQSNITSVGTLTSLTSSGLISTTGNISGNYIIGNGSQLTSLTGTNVTGQVANALIAGTVYTNAQPNITSVGTLTSLTASGLISTTGNVSGASLVGTIATAAQPTITSVGTLTSLNSGTISSSGNVTGANILTAGLISATGNVTGNYILGNGSQLTGIITSVSNVVNGGSNLNIGSANANVTISVSTVGNVAVFAPTGLSVLGTIAGNGNVTGGNILTAGIVSSTGNAIHGNILTAGLISATGNVTGNYFIGNGSQLTGITVAGSLSWTTQANTAPSGVNPGSFWYDSYSGVKYQYTNDGTSNVWVDQSFPTSFTTLAVTGNATIGGNLGVSGTLTANTISYANIASPGYVSAVGNVIGGNITTVGLITATGNVTGGNILTAGLISATGNITSGNLSVSTGTITVGNIVNGNGNAVGNIGSSSNYFNRIFATATTALYADLAEMYVADEDYAPGTVVEFGGEYEIRASNTTHSTSVAGIISTNPSYLMNAAQPGTHVVPVALTGRVPCLVVGKINKGDRLVASEIAGVAQALDITKYEPSCIIGKALENYDSTEAGVIEVAVGRT